jgi:hypothetical protein
LAATYRARRKALHSKYSLWPDSGEGCVYCGVPADTYDHVPPLSKVHALGPEHFEKLSVRFWIVPACRECNILLNKVDGDTVGKRKARIKVILRKRYAKYLNCGHWTREDIEELGYNLRQMIESGANIKEWVERRLKW